MSCVKVLCALGLLVVLASAYRPPAPRPGNYNLPQIPGYPPINPTFPGRDFGLPPVYKGKFKRSLEELPALESQAVYEEEPVLLEEGVRVVRSAEPLEELEVLPEQLHEELRRERRDYRIILPTYRPGPKRPPKTILV